ncbi:MAG: TrkA family potassium uptake protein [Thermodesulfobacteriota bacterium]
MKSKGSESLYIVIVGCGRLGSDLANRTSSAGHSVVVLDRAPEAFGNLSQDFSGFTVEGDATELRVLKQARMGKADVVFAATHDDNVNLMVAQVAGRIFAVQKVLARVFDPRREQVYGQLGIETICPTSVAVRMFLEKMEQPATGRKGAAS